MTILKKTNIGWSVIRTYQFRIKDASRKTKLKALASRVNFVWNYCNEISAFAWSRDRKWLSEFDLNNLTSGSSKELGLASDTIQSICREFVARRNKRKKPKLRWRSSKKNLGWVPVKSGAIRVVSESVIFQKQEYKCWKTRDIKGKLRSATFSQNAKGQWFVNLSCELDNPTPTDAHDLVGIDLGLTTLATLPTGEKIENQRTLLKFGDKLAQAQRANKKKQAAAINNKIKNVRKDFLHKESTKVVKRFKTICIGDVSSLKLAKTRMAKSTLDAGWGMFKSMLEYKAIALGVDFKIVNENYSSVTCSSCFEKSGPSGLSALGVREWNCNCGSLHDRDVNAAKNILRFGHETL